MQAGTGLSSWKFVTLVLCMMAGTASLPHILMRYFTTPSVRSARNSVAWSLFFIFLLYFTAPALATFTKLQILDPNLATGIIGKSIEEVMALEWIQKWSNVGFAQVIDANGDGILQLNEFFMRGIFDKRSVASPVVAGNLVFGSCGSGGGKSNYMVAVKLGGRGNVLKTHVAYHVRKAAPYVPTPLVVGDRIFTTDDAGIGSCIQASTGRVIWRERLDDRGFFASPVLIDGKIYNNTKGGTTIVMAAADKFQVLAKNKLGAGSYVTPCVDENRLYLRTFTHLMCLPGK